MMKIILIVLLSIVSVSGLRLPGKILLQGLSRISSRVESGSQAIHVNSKKTKNAIDDLIESILGVFPNVLAPSAPMNSENIIADPPKFASKGYIALRLIDLLSFSKNVSFRIHFQI